MSIFSFLFILFSLSLSFFSWNSVSCLRLALNSLCREEWLQTSDSSPDSWPQCWIQVCASMPDLCGAGGWTQSFLRVRQARSQQSHISSSDVCFSAGWCTDWGSPVRSSGLRFLRSLWMDHTAMPIDSRHTQNSAEAGCFSRSDHQLEFQTVENEK